MQKRMVFRGLAATVFLMAAAAPVWAALEGAINFTPSAEPQIDMAAITSSIDKPEDCAPVYMPTLVHERDGSIVGMAYVLDGDDC